MKRRTIFITILAAMLMSAGSVKAQATPQGEKSGGLAILIEIMTPAPLGHLYVGDVMPGILPSIVGVGSLGLMVSSPTNIGAATAGSLGYLVSRIWAGIQVSHTAGKHNAALAQRTSINVLPVERGKVQLGLSIKTR